MAQAVSIQAESSTNALSPGVKCRAGCRHISFDGHVYVMMVRGVKYWVAVLECECGVKRVTRYTPGTGQRVGGHRYDYTSAVGYPKERTQEECVQIWLESMLAPEE